MQKFYLMKKKLKKMETKKINSCLASFIVIFDLNVTDLTWLKNKQFYGNRFMEVKNQQTSE